jgi:acyl-CoA thioester hydrolase
MRQLSLVGVAGIIESTPTGDFINLDHSEPKIGRKLHSMQMPLRWGEMDALRHINNAQYLRYFEESRIVWGESLNMHLDGKAEGMILLKASVTYKKQVTYPGDIDVSLFAGEIGRSSFHLINTLTVEGDGTPAAIGDFVIVWFDYRSGKSLAIPDSLRAVLEAKGKEKGT